MISAEDHESDRSDPTIPASDAVHSDSMPRAQTFSLLRITLTVIGAMAIIAPLIIYFESGYFESGNGHSPGRGHLGASSGGSGMKNSPPFDLSNSTVPASQIRHGGPAKDGIPALSRPKWLTASDASYLGPENRVIGVSVGGQSRAYPLLILNYHEIVNDQLADQPVAVTYCPLCDSAAAFDRRTELGLREFGVSGLLFNSNVLMYDRTKDIESLWSQVKAEGISGPGANRSLRSIPIELTTWKDWKTRHPNTTVLSQETGHNRLYARDPYHGYLERSELMFPAEPQSDRLPAKERVLGVWSENKWRAYPQSEFSAKHKRVEETIEGRQLVVEFNPDANSLRVAKADKGIQWMYSLWFAWFAMHPETEIYRSESD